MCSGNDIWIMYYWKIISKLSMACTSDGGKGHSPAAHTQMNSLDHWLIPALLLQWIASPSLQQGVTVILLDWSLLSCLLFSLATVFQVHLILMGKSRIILNIIFKHTGQHSCLAMEYLKLFSITLSTG